MWMFGSDKLRQRKEQAQEKRDRREEERDRQREEKERGEITKHLEQRWQTVRPRYTDTYKRGDLLDIDAERENSVILSYANPLAAGSNPGGAPLDHGLLADAAGRFITQGLAGHAQKLFAIRDRSGLQPQDLVIRNLFFDRSLSARMRGDLRELRERIRFAVYHVAELIELDSVRRNTRRADLARAADSHQLQKLNRAAQGEYEFHVSYRSLAVAMKIFAQVNRQLKQEAAKAGRQGAKRDELDFQTQSALLVFEFLDVIIGHLKNFQIGGEDTLKSLYSEIEGDVKANEMADRDLEKRMDAIADQAAIGNDRRILENRKAGRRMVLDKWQGLLDKLTRASDKATRFTSKIAILEVKRDNARNQIGLMALLRLANFADENIQAVEALLDFDGLELEILEPEDFAGLLNMAPNEAERLAEGGGEKPVPLTAGSREADMPGGVLAGGNSGPPLLDRK
jgi:hypothetical protein